MRQDLIQPRPLKSPDIKHIIRNVTRGEALTNLPPEQRNSWPNQLHILEDRAERLIPLAFDQTYVQKELIRLLPKDTIQFTRLDNGIEVTLH